MDGKSSGAIGIIAIALCIGVLIASKMFFPSLFEILLWVIGIIVVLIVLLVGTVLWIALKKPKNEKDKNKSTKINSSVSEGRNKIMSARRICINAKNAEIKNSGIRICMKAEKILGVISREPEKIEKNRQFLNYYIPMFVSVIERYVNFEKSGIDSGDVAEKVLEHLTEMEKAFEKYHESLYHGDMLNLEVEMEALSIACKRDGLITEEDFGPAK